MKKHSVLQMTALVLCLLLGLAAPFLSALVEDSRNISSQPLSSDTSHYVYQGTLFNRVLALDAYLNTSPALREISREEGSYSDALSLWSSLSGFLPISGEYDLRCEYVTLAPKQYNAQYEYIVLKYQQENLTLSVTADRLSNLPIRIELKCAPDVMKTFIAENSTWDLIRSYTDLLDLGEPADVEYSESTILVSRSAPIRGVPYTAEMTVMPAGGVMFFKLTAVSE